MLLFGAPGLVRGPNGSEVHALQPKRAAVLTYLLVARPGPLHRRDSLLGMFWPEHSADRGRNALSKVIHHLGRALPPGAILTRGDQIGIADEHVWCDVREFERALANGRSEDALALYRGDLLQGFHIRGSPDFDHWSDVERSRLRRMAVAAAWGLASEAEGAGDGVRAIEFARQAVEWAPRDESGHRRLLHLLQSYGNRAEALEAFEEIREGLRRDYGVDPSGPTLELIEAIRDGSLPCDLAAPLQPNSEAASPTSDTPSSARLPYREASKPAPSTSPPIPPDTPPSKDYVPRRRLGAMAIAFVVITAIGLSASRGGPFSQDDGGAPPGRVLVTEFEDGTDEGLGAAISEALRIDWAQSAAMDLVDRADIAGTLALMGLEGGAPISAEVGRELAARDGLETVVEGSVIPVGHGYILTAAIRAGGDGRTIASLRESVTGPDEIIPAIEELSVGIREALGEELGTIQASLPLARVTTSSLEALKLYTRATQAFNQYDDRVQAGDLLERAVTLDPDFAMAWRMLAVALQEDADQSRRLEAVRQAYDHRDRLSELERYIVEAGYHTTIEVDRGRSVAALRRVLDVDPDHGRALNNLGINYLYLGEVERAEGVFLRAVKTPEASSTAHRNLVETRISLGRLEEAWQALTAFEQAYPEHEYLPGLRVRLRFLSGAIDEAKGESRRIVDDPWRPVRQRTDAWVQLGRMSYWEGKFEEGRSALLEAERISASGDDATVWGRAVETAHTAALVGDLEWARAHIEANLAEPPPENLALGQAVLVQVIELSALAPAGEALMTGSAVIASRLATVHARISSGDTLGVRGVIEGLPLHIFQRALLAERLGDTDHTIQLYETVLVPGYTGWGNTPHRLRGLMRLGQLREEAGDTLGAIEAYRSFAGQWASGDLHGRAIAERFEARALTLESELRASAK